jgi:hypothetical protein
MIWSVLSIVFPRAFVGAAGTFTISTGDCSLRRAATPLQLDYVLTCNAPAVQLETQAPRYTSRFVSAAAATTEVSFGARAVAMNARYTLLVWACLLLGAGWHVRTMHKRGYNALIAPCAVLLQAQECKVTRRYGVESTTTITLFDPAEFVAAAEEEEEPAAEAQAGRMANATEGLNKGATWYKAMFPALRKDGAGQRTYSCMRMAHAACPPEFLLRSPCACSRPCPHARHGACT